MEKQKYFDDVDILTSRPEGMEYSEYKARMKAQKQVIKQYLKGEMIHLSKLYKHPEVLKHFGFSENASDAEIYVTAMKEDDKKTALLMLKGLTYVNNK